MLEDNGNRGVATESALIATGSANRYLVKTSRAVGTYLYADDGNGHRMSICMRSPGEDFIVEASSSGGPSRESCTCICRHVEQFRIQSAIFPTKIVQ